MFYSKLLMLLLLILKLREYNGRNLTRTFLAREVNIKEVPFIVLVIPGDDGTCTGFLIDYTWVLTAAHCFLNTIKGCSVVLGTNDKQDNIERELAEKVFVHPLFKESDFGSEYDIALILLRRRAIKSEITNIISIDINDWPPENGKRLCYVAGYGRHHNLKRSGKLHGAQVSVGRGPYTLSCPLAEDYAEPFYWSYLNESEPLCFGDSGGPLVCDGMAAGISVISFPCNDAVYDVDCSNTYVDGYVVINKHLAWLRNHVKCLPTCAAFRKINYLTSKLLYILVSINILFIR